MIKKKHQNIPKHTKTYQIGMFIFPSMFSTWFPKCVTCMASKMCESSTFWACKQRLNWSCWLKYDRKASFQRKVQVNFNSKKVGQNLDLSTCQKFSPLSSLAHKAPLLLIQHMEDLAKQTQVQRWTKQSCKKWGGFDGKMAVVSCFRDTAFPPRNEKNDDLFKKFWLKTNENQKEQLWPSSLRLVPSSRLMKQPVAAFGARFRAWGEAAQGVAKWKRTEWPMVPEPPRGDAMAGWWRVVFLGCFLMFFWCFWLTVVFLGCFCCKFCLNIFDIWKNWQETGQQDLYWLLTCYEIFWGTCHTKTWTCWKEIALLEPLASDLYHTWNILKHEPHAFQWQNLCTRNPRIAIFVYKGCIIHTLSFTYVFDLI